MPLLGSRTNMSIGPEIRTSEMSLLRKRKASFNEPMRSHGRDGTGTDVLLDPLVIGQAVHVGNYPESPIDNVRRVLADYDDTSVPIVTEMMRLGFHGKRPYWEQASRWIKYEQVVEGDVTRFSRPHITLLNVQAMLQLRNCLKRGLVLLDVDRVGFDAIISHVLDSWKDKHCFDAQKMEKLRTVMFAAKFHLGGPPGVNVYDKEHAKSVENLLNGEISKERLSIVGESEKELSTKEPSEKIPPSEDDESDIGEEPGQGVNPQFNIRKIIYSNRRLVSKLPLDSISCTIFVGEAPFLERTLTAFIRLKDAQNLHPDIPDIPVPTKFIFILLSPGQNYDNEATSIGRTMGCLVTDEIFPRPLNVPFSIWRRVALYTKEPHTLADGIEEFFSQIVAIPPGKCETTTRWEPRETSTQATRSIGMLYATYETDDEVFDDEEKKEEGEGHSRDIVRTGRCCGGLIEDIKRKSRVYASEFGDFFRGRLTQSLAATIFLFFANITSIITFGAVMERALHHQMAAMEAIVCGGISGVIFALFSGQPLNILSATGPTLVFEKILFDFCMQNHWEFLPFRFWVGVWIAFFLLVLVVTDMSALVGLITRFTEEAFATLISVVFIIQAFQKLHEISHDAPLIQDPRTVYHSPCYCYLDQPSESNHTSKLMQRDVSVEDCEKKGGESFGLQCHFKPDVYMFSVLLTFGTFFCAYSLNKFRHSRFFSGSIRNSISDFAVLISIVLMTCFSLSIGLDVPTLNMPTDFKPTMDRPWLINPWTVPETAMVVAALPALFYTILIVMDQQITAVIVNRKDNKLKKGGGYHLDLLVIAILVMICSSLGLPYYVAATVLSVMHIDSLRMHSESTAPGEIPHFLGVKEQRLTALLAHVLIGLSGFLTQIIKLVPLPVLIGIFLYMGVVSLLGQQFVQRIALLFIPDKHQPDYIWLRTVRMKRVHLFTFLQIGSMGALFLVKYTKMISMMFPLMLVVMVLVRMFILGRIFTQSELVSLDDMVPSFGEIMSPSKRSREATTRPDDEEALRS